MVNGKKILVNKSLENKSLVGSKIEYFDFIQCYFLYFKHNIISITYLYNN